MPKQYACLAQVTVGAGGASSIEFTSIPNTYTDLILKLSLRSSGSSGFWDPTRIILNSSATLVTSRYIYGSGSGVGSEAPGTTDSNIFNYSSNANNTSNTFANIDVHIPNYTSTSIAKTISSDGVAENNATDAIATLGAAIWNPGSQAAVTTIAIKPYLGGSSWVQYSTATLYGITNS